MPVGFRPPVKLTTSSLSLSRGMKQASHRFVYDKMVIEPVAATHSKDISNRFEASAKWRKNHEGEPRLVLAYVN